MQAFYADLHIHLGEAQGRPVKISASRQLTVAAVARHAAQVKGLQLAGIVDACCQGGLAELRALVRAGQLAEVSGGGLRWAMPASGRAVTLILGCEAEIREDGRPAVHWLAYFGGLAEAGRFAEALWRSVRNPWLSTQRTAWDTAEFIGQTALAGGLALPAHAFTPHKGFYGASARRLQEVLPAEAASQVVGIELGLSADSRLADQISELHGRTYLSNSDAHSLPVIGREHNRLLLAEATFAELALAVGGQSGRAVTGNFGLDPRLGKYYRTVCRRCGEQAAGPPPQRVCPACGGEAKTTGVLDRLAALADCPPGSGPQRPPYVHQVPLQMLPGLGPRSLERLIARFGSELAVLHEAPAEALQETQGRRWPA